MGGLKINADAEILDTQGNVIPGLYAAGETTGGTQSAGPYELRLPIFLQPLGGALKNRSAAPASPPCFRRRRTGCGTQHPLRLACVSLAAAQQLLAASAAGGARRRCSRLRCCSNPPEKVKLQFFIKQKAQSIFVR